MMARKRRDHPRKQIVIVVLEGVKVVSTDMAPLCKAMRDVSNPDDEIIVLTLLHVKNTSEPLSSAGHCNQQSCDQADPHIRFLHEEISHRKDVYLKVFRPYYNSCKSNGVKFQVKIAAGFRPKDIVIEEANNVKANWIIMDRCFAKHLTFLMRGTDCNISLVGDDEEGIVQSCLPTHEAPESSVSRDLARNPKSPKLREGSISDRTAETSSECEPCSPSLPVNLSKESENQTISDPTTETIPVELKIYDIVSTKADIFLGQPMEIKKGFKARNWNGQNGNYINYCGYLKDNASFILVKRLKGNSDSILEAERKAALFLHHKNILSLLGYHKSDEHDVVLVFPLVIEGTLDKHLCDLSRKRCKLTFQDKLNIAMGIAHGIRYMHEECPRGPIAHGELQLSNIFLTSNLQPMISGFEHATWLQLKQESPAFNNRCQLEDSLDHESVLLIKSDIFAFGVLLLRLFCRRSVPQDDKILIEWARPLLLDRAFHLLLEEDSDDLDMHAIYRVMCAAGMCTMSKPISRPPISKVISTLKGENFCIIQSSPSDTSA